MDSKKRKSISMEELKEMAEESVKQWDAFEDDVRDIIKKKGYDLSAIAPSMPCMYAEMCESLEMSFENAVTFALSAISKVYGVEIVRVNEGGDHTEADIHTGSDTHH